MRYFRDCFLAFLNEPYYSCIESPPASDRYSACHQPLFKLSCRSPASSAFKPTESSVEPTDTHTSLTLEQENASCCASPLCYPRFASREFVDV